MLHKFFFGILLLGLLLSNCTPQIEGDKRSVISGTVVDDNGIPIENLTVVTKNFDFDLGVTTTDRDGYFEFVSLLSNRDRTTIEINSNAESAEYVIYKIPLVHRDLSDIFDVGTIILRQRAILNFKIENTSDSDASLTWSLDYVTPGCITTFDDVTETEVEDCYPINTIFRSHEAGDPIFERNISTTLNSDAIFTYSFDDENFETITIPINSQQTTYEFTY